MQGVCSEMDPPAHFCFLTIVLQTSSYCWSSASCPLPGRLLPVRSFSLVLPDSWVAGYMSHVWRASQWLYHPLLAQLFYPVFYISFIAVEKNLLIICFFFKFVVSFLLLECRFRRVEILNFLIIDVFLVFVKATTSCQGLYYL